MRDYLRGTARLHHLAFWVDSREDVLRAADLMNDARVPIEAGPSRHIPIQGFYLYTREPGGNRVEICSGGYLGFDPDDEPVVWTPGRVRRQARLGRAAALDVPALRHAPEWARPRRRHVGLALAALTRFPDAAASLRRGAAVTCSSWRTSAATRPRSTSPA